MGRLDRISFSSGELSSLLNCLNIKVKIITLSYVLLKVCRGNVQENYIINGEK